MFRCIWIQFLENAPDFREFVHQVTFCVKSSGRVQNEIIRTPACGCLIGVKGDGCRIGPLLACNERQVEPLAPCLELFVRGGPKSVACSDQDGFPLVGQPFSQLGGGGCFPGAIDSDQADHLWFAFDRGEPAFRSFKSVHQHTDPEGGRILIPQFLVGPIAFFDGLHDLVSRFETEIRTIEGFLHEADGVIIQFSPAEYGSYLFGGFGKPGSEETE